jgi:hypothetical protein
MGAPSITKAQQGARKGFRMDSNIADVLEALANLLYLARASLDDRRAADLYLARAEHVVEAYLTSEKAASPTR